MGAKHGTQKGVVSSDKKSLWEVIAERGGKGGVQKSYAVFIAEEHKMLRCAPKNGTPYIPGCQIMQGSVVELLPVGGTEKYAAVKIHGMQGYMRRKHLVPVATYTQTAAAQHRRAVLMFWLLNKRLQVPPAACVSVISNIYWEMIPYWLLPGQGETSQDICCSKLVYSHKRSTQNVSSNRRKDLAKYLTAWKVSFSKRYGRGPHALDVWTDATVASMYEEYESIEKSRQKGRDSLSSDEQKRRRVLCRQLKQWMGQYQEEHKRIPSKKRLLAEPEVSELYKEYLSLTGKPDPTISPNYHNPYVENTAAEVRDETPLPPQTMSMSSHAQRSPRAGYDVHESEHAEKSLSSVCVSPSPERVLSSPAGDDEVITMGVNINIYDSGDEEGNEEEPSPHSNRLLSSSLGSTAAARACVKGLRIKEERTVLPKFASH